MPGIMMNAQGQVVPDGTHRPIELLDPEEVGRRRAAAEDANEDFCEHCASSNRRGANYCAYCGDNLAQQGAAT